MWWDQQFTPEQDGDRYERLWWHFLKDDFPEWGTFWSHHVVPLTNRIDNNLKNRHGKLFFRNDQSIYKGVEALMMANYSVFYYLTRSCAIVVSEPHLFPEDVFIFLRATTENIAKFLDIFANRLAKRLNINNDQVPKWTDIKESEPAKNILQYRDAFVHSARLGRHPNLPREFIPNSSHISKAQHYWRYVQNLPEDQFVDSRKYLRELQKDLMKEINPVWKRITHLLDERRSSEAYLKFYRLDKDASGKFRPVQVGPSKLISQPEIGAGRKGQIGPLSE